MLTYTLDKSRSDFLYEQLYLALKDDIERGRLAAGERLPSKRALAAHLGVSVVTIEKAYSQLVDEGYLAARPKSGYYVTKIEAPLPAQKPSPAHSIHLAPSLSATTTAASPLGGGAPQGAKGAIASNLSIHLTPKRSNSTTAASPSGGGAPQGAEGAIASNLPSQPFADFTANQLSPENFPFTSWARALKQTLAERQKELMETTPVSGAMELRTAIAAHLASFRGMSVSPEQIVIGAGTEYLYSLVVRFLGTEKIFALENPGYAKVRRIYEGCGARCRSVPLDASGLDITRLRESGASVAHISPSHHFPTGLVMPIARRYELLAWASECPGRYILEDDYDSEFRFVGRPIPTLFSIDAAAKVIYLNTFSKTLTPTIRLSYMVLPAPLAERFRARLSFLACPVSNFEQYTLARFIEGGHFEKHLARMRTLYRKKRDLLIRAIKESPLRGHAEIIEQSSGLHLLLKLATQKSDAELKRRFQKQSLKVDFLADYYQSPREAPAHILLLNYSSIQKEKIPAAIARLAKAVGEKA